MVRTFKAITMLLNMLFNLLDDEKGAVEKMFTKQTSCNFSVILTISTKLKHITDK